VIVDFWWNASVDEQLWPKRYVARFNWNQKIMQHFKMRFRRQVTNLGIPVTAELGLSTAPKCTSITNISSSAFNFFPSSSVSFDSVGRGYAICSLNVPPYEARFFYPLFIPSFGDVLSFSRRPLRLHVFDCEPNQIDRVTRPWGDSIPRICKPFIFFYCWWFLIFPVCYDRQPVGWVA
jgi:hypothetical protein